MGKRKAQTAGRQAQFSGTQARRHGTASEDEEDADVEDASQGPPDMSSRRRAAKPPSKSSILRTELEESQSRLKTSQDDLKATLSDCEAQRRHILFLERKLSALQLQVESLHDELTQSNDLAASLSDELSATLHTLTTTRAELKTTSSKVTRLKREREKARIASKSAETEIYDDLAQQRESLHAERARIDSLTTQLDQSLLHAQSLSTKLKMVQRERLIYKKRAERAQPTLKATQKALKEMQNWKTKDGTMYCGRMRRLIRQLDAAGVACKHIPHVLSLMLPEFGVKAKRLPSPRTIRRIVKEGGFLSKVKLGRELAMAKAYGLSSDGTTFRSVNYESRHITLPIPDYKNPNAKPVFRTVMLDLNHAHDHTAQTQFEGDVDTGAGAINAYRKSPIYDAKEAPIDNDDFLRKQNRQNLDHAADGKKKVDLMREGRQRVAEKDLGKAKFTKMEELDQFNAAGHVNDKALENEFGVEFVSKMSVSERQQARVAIVVRQLGEEAFNALPEDEQRRLTDILFAGCMCHKDLNVFQYAVEFLEKMWPPDDGPAMLANKANDAVIRLSDDPNTPAVRNALESSSRGAVKLIELCAMIFRNKNDVTGYLQTFNDFMEKRKTEMYPQEVKSKLVDPHKAFPDVQRCRFQTISYAAAELFMFLNLYIELVETVVDSKVKSGSANHLESNLLKGFRCLKTQTELAAETLYAVCVSWPYMRYARGGGSESGGLINLLDTVEFHRSLIPFCQRLADNPALLLDPDTADSTLTIDGQAFIDSLVIAKIRSRASELPDLERAITAMFRGAISGWDVFTEEFKVGGSIDKLTAEERDGMFIPSTNDANEGGLGFLRQQKLKNPAGTVDFFCARALYRRNGTEDFISAHASSREMVIYAMRETRKQDASGSMKIFRQDRAQRLIKKAADNKQRRERHRQKVAERLALLLATPVIVDGLKLNRLTVKELTAQMRIHWRVFQDPVLVAIPNKSVLSRKADMLAAVKAAVQQPPKLSVGGALEKDILMLTRIRSGLGLRRVMER
ncbi:hypothetical protein C8F01DRAFT_1093502 [Mycena amicta]|nr:hypothetical protein C8F01DRAFT_1093502 [Mycena amicta]